MVLSPGLYGAVDDKRGRKALLHAAAASSTFIDTSDGYGSAELVVTFSDGRSGSLLRSATEDASGRQIRQLNVFASPAVPPV